MKLLPKYNPATISILIITVGQKYQLDLSKEVSNHTAKSVAKLATGQPPTMTVTIDSSNRQLISLASTQIGFSSLNLKLEVITSEQAFFASPHSKDMPITIFV